jgi:maleylpyruvate isomerase
VGAPLDSIDGCRQSHAALHSRIDGLTDEWALQPSSLPGWTRGHVLTHIARNADGIVRLLDGAARGEMVEQYSGGVDGRTAAIEAGARRPADQLIEDVRSSSELVERSFAGLPNGAWDNPVRTVRGVEFPAHFVVFHRWREVETHHVDLNLGHTPADWPRPMVAGWLELELPTLADRTDPVALLAWVTGRGAAPLLADW